MDSDGIRNEDREIMEEQKRAVMASAMEVQAREYSMKPAKPFPDVNTNTPSPDQSNGWNDQPAVT